MKAYSFKVKNTSLKVMEYFQPKMHINEIHHTNAEFWLIFVLNVGIKLKAFFHTHNVYLTQIGLVNTIDTYLRLKIYIDHWINNKGP